MAIACRHADADPTRSISVLTVPETVFDVDPWLGLCLGASLLVNDGQVSVSFSCLFGPV
jgi:hypothetical protein